MDSCSLIYPTLIRNFTPATLSGNYSLLPRRVFHSAAGFQAAAINSGRNEKARKFDDTVSSLLPLKVS